MLNSCVFETNTPLSLSSPEPLNLLVMSYASLSFTDIAEAILMSPNSLISIPSWMYSS